MLMQELYKVLADDTWITIINNSNFSRIYNGILNDIPVSLLDSQIISITSTDFNSLLISIA